MSLRRNGDIVSEGGEAYVGRAEGKTIRGLIVSLACLRLSRVDTRLCYICCWALVTKLLGRIWDCILDFVRPTGVVVTSPTLCRSNASKYNLTVLVGYPFFSNEGNYRWKVHE